MGSPSYIAPEVLHESAHYNETADVYSFGILLWFVSQHECLAYNRTLYSSIMEHKALMKPYQSKFPAVFCVRALCVCVRVRALGA